MNVCACVFVRAFVRAFVCAFVCVCVCVCTFSLLIQTYFFSFSWLIISSTVEGKKQYMKVLRGQHLFVELGRNQYTLPPPTCNTCSFLFNLRADPVLQSEPIYERIHEFFCVHHSCHGL